MENQQPSFITFFPYSLCAPATFTLQLLKYYQLSFAESCRAYGERVCVPVYKVLLQLLITADNNRQPEKGNRKKSNNIMEFSL